MPICEICGMEVVSVNECECGAKFCDECGDVKRKLCYDCLGWEQEGGEKTGEEDWEREDLGDEEEEWDDEDWDEDEPN